MKMVLFFLIGLVGCITANPQVENDNLNFEIYGYSISCTDTYTLYVDDNGNWKQVNTKLPSKGQYYLDGNYIDYGMCDVMTCDRLPEKNSIKLVEYVNSGKKFKDNLEVPSFETRILHGKIKADVNYYSIVDCKFQKSISMIVNN
jgi:hypothetical protein